MTLMIRPQKNLKAYDNFFFFFFGIHKRFNFIELLFMWCVFKSQQTIHFFLAAFVFSTAFITGQDVLSLPTEAREANRLGPRLSQNTKRSAISHASSSKGNKYPGKKIKKTFFK